MMFLFNKFKEWIIGAGLFIALILGVYTKGILKGRDQIKQKQKEADEKNKQTRNEKNEEIKNLSDDDLDARGSRWVRK